MLGLLVAAPNRQRPEDYNLTGKVAEGRGNTHRHLSPLIRLAKMSEDQRSQFPSVTKDQTP